MCYTEVKKVFVKQVTVVNNNTRYEVVKTVNINPSEDTKIGHILTQAEINTLMNDWEVEIS